MDLVYIQNRDTRVAGAKAHKGGVVVASVKFLPGNNIVKADDYNKVRVHLEDKLKSKSLVELHVEKKESGKDGKDIKYVSIPFSQLKPEQAEELVTKAYNTKQLAMLKKQESRDAVRVAIAEQIEQIEKFKAKATKKKSTEE